MKRKCPKCGNIKNFLIEKCPDGNTTCYVCGYKAQHSEFFKAPPKKNTLEQRLEEYVEVLARAHKKNKRLYEEAPSNEAKEFYRGAMCSCRDTIHDLCAILGIEMPKLGGTEE